MLRSSLEDELETAEDLLRHGGQPRCTFAAIPISQRRVLLTYILAQKIFLALAFFYPTLKNQFVQLPSADLISFLFDIETYYIFSAQDG